MTHHGRVAVLIDADFHTEGYSQLLQKISRTAEAITNSNAESCWEQSTILVSQAKILHNFRAQNATSRQWVKAVNTLLEAWLMEFFAASLIFGNAENEHRRLGIAEV